MADRQYWGFFLAVLGDVQKEWAEVIEDSVGLYLSVSVMVNY